MFQNLVSWRRAACCLGAALVWFAAVAVADELEPDAAGRSIRRLVQMRIDSGDPLAARQAWQRLVQCGASVLPEILAAMSEADAVGVNWLRTAFDAIVRRERRAADPRMPWDRLRTLVTDPSGDGRARRLALATLEEAHPGTTKELLPQLIDDPEFRSQAVQLLTARADAAADADQAAQATVLYRQALSAAVDYDQIVNLANRLDALGETVDVLAKLGMPEQWQVLGPFPGDGMTGFDRVYPPELQVDTDGEYRGVSGTIRWREVAPLRDGSVDLNAALGISSDTVAYAYAEFHVSQAVRAELLAGADDNLAVWVNGRRVFAFPHYHQHLRPDRHRVAIGLDEGKNTLLLKICQAVTPPNYPRPNRWQFTARLVDREGKPLPGEWK